MPRLRPRSASTLLRRREVMPAWVRRIDRGVARRVNTRRSPERLDRGFRRLSDSANYGRLWLTIAAVLVIFGRPRPALRGMASLSVASFIANAVGKQLFGGERPLLKDVPLVRHLKKQPTSKSFPSGHSASAAAFAAGVALENPRAGAVVAPVAAAVIYSRLHVGAHWFSDVVGGAALGAGVALAGRLLVPARPLGRSAVAAESAISLPALVGGEGLLVVANRGSGAKPMQTDPVQVVRERLPRADIHLLDPGDDAAEVVRSALVGAAPPRVVGVAGGDGTVAAIAHVARTADVPLLVLPAGTFNHFARTAGLESLDDAIDALAAGTGRGVDVGELRIGAGDPVTVTNAASIGVYADFVTGRERLIPTLGKWLGGLVVASRLLRRAERVDVELGGRPRTVWSLSIGIGRNLPSTVTPLQRLTLDDGLLDVRVLRAASRLRAVGSLAFGRRTSAVLRTVGLVPGGSEVGSFTAREVTFALRPRPGQVLAVAHDGEVTEVPETQLVGGACPVSVRVVPAALALYAPGNRP